MSDAGPSLSVQQAPAVEAPPAIEIEIDDSAFDRDAALATVRGEQTPEEPVAPEPEKSPEQQTDEEREANRRKKLSDEKGKLSQDKLDAAFAKLTAEGKRMRTQREAFKAERATFDQAKAQYDAAIETAATRVTSQEKEWADLTESAKTTPLKVLEKLGWSVPKLVAFIQNDGKHTPEEQINETRTEYDKRLAEQSAELERLKNSVKERDFKSAAGAYEAKATETMRALVPTYEFVSKYDLTTEIVPKVLQNIAHIYREGGQLGDKQYPKGTALDPKTVLDYFEAQEVKQLARFGIRPGQAGATSSVVKPGAVQPKTLSNADTASRGVKPPVAEDETFDREAALEEIRKRYS
jgi:hypothetical protein